MPSFVALNHVAVTRPLYLNRTLRQANLLTVRPGPFGETPRLAFTADPAKLPQGMEGGLVATSVYKAEVENYPNGCHVCEVEIDPAASHVQWIPGRPALHDEAGETERDNGK